jgi:hypothetical protein
MKVELGTVSLDLPEKATPLTFVAVGAEDSSGAVSKDLYGTTENEEPRRQRRAFSAAFGPVDPSKSAEEHLNNAVKNIQLGMRGKAAKLEDRTVGELQGKYCELEYVGSAKMEQTSFIFLAVHKGTIHTYSYTALNGPGLAPSRDEFAKLLGSIKLNQP